MPTTANIPPCALAQQDLAPLAALHASVAQLSEWLSSATNHHRITAQKAFLRTLDLRCRLEQLVIVPALRASAGLPQEVLDRCECELAQVRDRIETVTLGLADAPQGDGSVVLAANAAMTHFDEMDALLLEPACVAALDAHALAAQIDAWTARWTEEIRATGDIEDEELDPVGLPPR